LSANTDQRDLVPLTKDLSKIESEKPFQSCLSTAVNIAAQPAAQQCNQFLKEMD